MTARELLERSAEGYLAPTTGYDVLAARVERVLSMHVSPEYARGYCLTCGATWPCPTVRALDGEDA